MFGRQWFDCNSQFGLTESGLALHNELLNRQINNSLQLALKLYVHARSTENVHLSYYWLRQFHRISHIQHVHSLIEDGQKSALIVYFSGFWDGFNPCQSEIWNYLQSICPDAIQLKLDDTLNPDIEVISCFDHSQRLCFKSKSSTRILYLGESVKPCFYQFDYSISMLPSRLHGLNAYLPLWCLRLEDYANYHDSSYEPLCLAKLTSAAIVANQGKSLSFVGNNYTPERQALLSIFASDGWRILEYGAKQYIHSKAHALSRATFNLSIENLSLNGYITEKVFDSFSAPAVPIYNFLNGSLRYINSRSFIGYSDHLPLCSILAQCNQLISASGSSILLPPLLQMKTVNGILRDAEREISSWLQIFVPRQLGSSV